MAKRRKRVATAWSIAGIVALGLGIALAAWLRHPAASDLASSFATVPVPAAEQAATLWTMRPVKRARPVIAVVAANDGTETTDFLLPLAVLREARVGEVWAVAPEARPVQLMPALRVRPDLTVAAFDLRYPEGADYVVVPALHRRDDPAVVAWLRAQAARGATIVGVCSGGKTLAAAGLLDGRRATGHWDDVADLRAAHPTMRYVPHRRYVADGGIVTTTGVSASLPVSLALVEAIAGRERAAAVARRLGVGDWSARHNSAAFALTREAIATAVRNRLAWWRHEDVALPVMDGVDDVALAFTADAWSRTWRSRAMTVARDAAPIRTRSGLTLLPDRASTGGMARQAALPVREPAEALNGNLAAIREAYDPATAQFVALQLEHPWR